MNARTLAVSFTLAMAAFPACSQPAGQTVSGPGYTVFQPQGWTISADPVGGTVTLREPGGAWAMLAPYHVGGGALSEQGARDLLEQMTTAILPQAPWGAAQAAGSNTMRRAAQDSQGTAIALMNGVSDAQGTAGTVACFYAPGATHSAHEETFARILETFGPSSLARYRRWTDPTEGAFSVEVPEGYEVRGGVVRSLGGTHIKVEVFTADGAVYLAASNDFPPFLEPSAQLALQGVAEGGQMQTFLPGVSIPVRQYRPGAQFITGLLLPEWAGAGNFQVLATRDRSNLPLIQQINQLTGEGDSRVNALFGQCQTLERQCHAGEADYLIRRGQAEMRGTAFVITQRTALTSHSALSGSQTFGLWGVYTGLLAEALPDRFAEATTHAAHFIGTFQLNTEWVVRETRMQAQLVAERSRIISQTNDEIREIMFDTWQARSEAQDRVAEAWSGYIRGTEIVVDPATGERYEVDAGEGYYWLNSDGTYGASSSSTDFDPLNSHQLVRLSDMPD